MTHECYYNKNKSRRERRLVNRTYKTRDQIMKAVRKNAPKTLPLQYQIEQLKLQDFELELR